MHVTVASGDRSRTIRRLHWLSRAILLLYLLWIPLPFASVVPGAWLLLTLPPLLLLAALAAIDLPGDVRWKLSPAAIWWSLGAIVFSLVVLIQILPLPPVVVRGISGEAHTIWIRAAEIVNTIRPDLVPKWFFLSVDPAATARGLVGILARLALFALATQLFRTSASRVALATSLTAAAAFQILYGIGHWTGSLVEIWGRDNLTDGRMSGTFVNPNHLGNYLALTLPLSLYLLVRAWYNTRHERSVAQRVETTLLRHSMLVLAGGAGTMIGIFGVLLTKSRGTLLSLAVASLIGFVLFFEENGARRQQKVRRFRRRAVWTGIALILVIGVSIIHLGTERITRRMMPDREGFVTLAGRIEGARLAIETWERFPIAGSGFETFDDVSLIVAKEGRLHHSHAHNDWLEILATTGLAGGAVVLIFLVPGLVAMARQIWPAMLGRPVSRSSSGDWRRFAALSVISILIFCLHSIVDFNFYIPANSYTLAVIAGATIAVPAR